MNDSDCKEDMEQQENELGVNILSKDVSDDNPGRPGRRTSKVWQVFNRLNDNNAECTLCSRVLSYKSSVTNLSKHIQRKHSSTYLSLCADEDPREGLKEFITIDSSHGEATMEECDGQEEDPIRPDDTEWLPPTKSARKSNATPKKVIKKEVISSNGVDYVIYTQDQVTTRPTPTVTKSATKRNAVVTPQRPTPVRNPVVTSAPVLTSPPPRPPAEEDEFSTFAKFLSQRIRALKNPYWQSCAINEINSALHRIEMRRYEVPKVDSAQSFVQTDPLDPLELKSGSIVTEQAPVHEAHHVVEVITQGDIV